MKTIVKGTVLLFVFIIAMSVMLPSNAEAIDTELFVYKSPDFTVNVPKDWYKTSTIPHPAIVLEKRHKKSDIDSFIVAVMDLPEGVTLNGGAERYIGYLKKAWNANNCQTLYEREIKLKDGAPASEYEIKWDNTSQGLNSLYTYRVVAFKDKKSIAAEITSDKQISDELKQLPLSLSFPVSKASLPQGSKKTITLPSGDVIWDLNGEWDVFVENYGPTTSNTSYPQVFMMTQKGGSFSAIRMMDDRWNAKGSESVRGDIDKNGINSVTIMAAAGPSMAKGFISDDGNKMIIDDGVRKLTCSRK